jgi:hypothetical protein
MLFALKLSIKNYICPMKVFAAAFFLFLTVSGACAQDRILFLNGKERQVGKIFGLQNQELVYSRQGDTTRRTMSINRIFSVRSADGKESIIYRPDSAMEYHLTPDQMRMFITGEQEAAARYRNYVPFITGTAFGVGGGLVIPFFATLSLVPPATGVLVSGWKVPDVARQPISDRKYLESPDFIAGYQSRARSRNIRNACIGGGAGLVATFAVLVLKGALR